MNVFSRMIKVSTVIRTC